MPFKLSGRSTNNLKGVDIKLVNVVRVAIELTTVDFAVICGLRTIGEQKRLVARGASQTMASKHLEGNAVDLMAFVGRRGCWELNVYDDIAESMRSAAIMQDTPIRWGAAWHIHDIRDWSGSMEEAMNSYIDSKRSQGKRPFIDAPHFEIGKEK